MRSNLWLIHPNGTGLHRLTRNPDGDFSWGGSAFSPDGTMIVAARTPGVGDDGNADIYVMDVGGTHVHNVTQTEIWDSAPAWGMARRSDRGGEAFARDARPQGRCVAIDPRCDLVASSPAIRLSEALGRASQDLRLL
jgi:hypothetical protein